MIRKTLATTKAATFSIHLPNPSRAGVATPAGTGFFVSPDGWFLTAAHVVMINGQLRDDLNKAILDQSIHPNTIESLTIFRGMDVEVASPDVGADFALMKVDPGRNPRDKPFPYLQVSRKELEEGSPVYAFGYP